MSPLKIQLGGSYSVLTYYLFRVLLLEINVKLKIIRSLVGNTCSKWLIWNILNTCSKLVCLKYLESWILEILVQSFRENTWTKTNLEKPSQYCYDSSPLLFLSLSSKGSILLLFIVVKIYKVEIKFSDLTLYFQWTRATVDKERVNPRCQVYPCLSHMVLWPYGPILAIWAKVVERAKLNSSSCQSFSGSVFGGNEREIISVSSKEWRLGWKWSLGWKA